jgi:hypothetical protein
MPGFEKLIKKISSKNYKKKELALSGQEIDDEKAIKLARALKDNSYIEELDVSNNRITFLGAKALSETNLKKLKINNNPIGDNGIRCIASSKQLVVLEAQACEITSQGSNLLFANTILESINLSFNHLAKEGFLSLVTNTTLRTLILQQVRIDDNCVELIAQNRSLRKVNLSTNSLIRRGAMFLFSSPTIEDLNLSQIRLDNLRDDIFDTSKSLKRLVLFSCDLTSASIGFLSKNRSLVELDLKSNYLDNDCTHFLTLIPTLRFLSLSDNKITAEGAKILRQSKSIKVLGLGGNPIEKEDVKEKCEFQAKNKKLKVVSDTISSSVFPEPKKEFPLLVQEKTCLIEEGEKRQSALIFNKQLPLRAVSAITKDFTKYPSLAAESESIFTQTGRKRARKISGASTT